MNLIEFLRDAKIEDLGLPTQISQKLKDQNITEFQKTYAAVQTYRVFGKCSIEGLTKDEIQLLDQKFTDLMVAHGLIKRKQVSTRSETRPAPTPIAPIKRAATTSNTKPAAAKMQITREETTPSQSALSPLVNWENRLAPQLRKVELVGEIPVTQEELNDISLHFKHLFQNRSEQTVLDFIGRHYPATFMVFMVGQGIHGYNCGDFWPAYEQALNPSINHSDFGRLFEKLLGHFAKPQFHELQEKSLRYVSLILAHGGIPVYCLKDFFSNIVLNCAVRPQLFALEGEELVDEVLKHVSYTANTDKPVLYFLEYGGRTAANLLDRSRKMLLSWQQNKTILSTEEAGLPAHLTQYFAEWARENTSFTVERGSSRSRLKRPQLSLDPWGLGIFLFLPSQPVSALNMSGLYWKVEAGDYQEQIKARTQRKGDQLETREVTLRLNEVSENIRVRFSQGENEFEWKINGYSPDQLILAFDPLSGQIQNHILARETWLMYPNHFSLSILAGEGNLLEELPDLPGQWSKFRLECWDLSHTSRLGLLQFEQVFSEISVRSQEKVLQPSLEGGKLIRTNLEETTSPVYVGMPPLLRIPFNRSDDLQAELSRWKIYLESIGTADPEVSFQTTLADLQESACSIVENTAVIRMSAPQFLNSRPVGTYQLGIKGPLGRDATFTLQILPECEISGLKELYIPDRSSGPQSVTFSVQTSLLDSLDSLNGEDGIKVETLKPGVHEILVPAEISSVGLLVRRETIQNQFVRIPLYFRIKRLRWRLVGNNGLLENWLQKHSTLSVQELLQQESPLLIIDLPGNDDGELSLQINLLDIQGNIIQQLQPADRSSKHSNRFWRFDLTKIKHSLEMNDSPIFRVDLAGKKSSTIEDEFNLPVLVFTREIHVMQLSTKIYSSPEQNHLLVNWQEKHQLRSRALILWSLFCPWQPPIIEKIPDAACGEYEFAISKQNHAEGVYRMQMVVVDPWAPTPPPLLPPLSGKGLCHDVEISSPQDRLKKLEQDINTWNTHQSTQFNNRIEISIIRQYLGQMEASRFDLEACCRNLRPATSREILILRSILSQANSEILEKEFGSQIILPEVLSRFYQDMREGKITLSEFTSVLELAPHSKTWPAQACEILVQLEDPKIRFRALDQLVTKDISKAINWIIKLLQQSSLSIKDAVDLLYEEKPNAMELLRENKGDPISEQLMELLRRYDLFSGLPVVKTGSWVFTNAGLGMINEILDPNTRISVDSFLEGDGKYILSVTLHIYLCNDFSGEKALINMATNEIIFPRANRIFICQHCQEFASTKPEIFKKHLIADHGNALLSPAQTVKTIGLTGIQFNMNPQQNKRDM